MSKVIYLSTTTFCAFPICFFRYSEHKGFNTALRTSSQTSKLYHLCFPQSSLAEIFDLALANASRLKSESIFPATATTAFLFMLSQSSPLYSNLDDYFNCKCYLVLFLFEDRLCANIGHQVMLVDADAPISLVCYHCKQSLTRPDIKVRPSSIPATLGSHGFASSQVTVVEGMVAATLADISELDREIVRLEVATKDLLSKRADLQAFASNHKSLLNIVIGLPADVLSQIFQQCVTVPWLENTSNSWSWDKKCDKTPLAIASVSRRWRTVALDTPRMWSEFSLNIRMKHSKKHIELARMWLSRSGNCPLSIRLETQADYSGAVPKLMEIFAACSRRWCNIQLMLPWPMLKCMSAMVKLPANKSQMPMLDILRWRTWNGMDSIDWFAHAPRLRCFYADFGVTTKSLTLPWSQLRDIDLRSEAGGLHTAVDLLTRTLNVERCSLRIQDELNQPLPLSPAPPSTGPITVSYCDLCKGKSENLVYEATHAKDLRPLAVNGVVLETAETVPDSMLLSDLARKSYASRSLGMSSLVTSGSMVKSLSFKYICSC